MAMWCIPVCVFRLSSVRLTDSYAILCGLAVRQCLMAQRLKFYLFTMPEDASQSPVHVYRPQPVTTWTAASSCILPNQQWAWGIECGDGEKCDVIRVAASSSVKSLTQWLQSVVLTQSGTYSIYNLQACLFSLSRLLLSLDDVEVKVAVIIVIINVYLVAPVAEVFISTINCVTSDQETELKQDAGRRLRPVCMNRAQSELS